MKRSRSIGLLVLGTAALLTGCSDVSSDDDVRQQSYASKADCERDWNDSKQPQQQSLCSPSGHGGGYLGPRYYWSHGGGSPVAVMPDGSHRAMTNTAFARSPAAMAARSSGSGGHSFGSVSRGGFGGMGHAGSAGG
jgi:hypothetical protein